MGFVTVNSKSLVVIPKSVRDQARIYPGDKLKMTYSPEGDAVIIKKIADVKSLSEDVSGMWVSNKFKLEEEKESSDERIERILKNKLRQKGVV